MSRVASVLIVLFDS